MISLKGVLVVVELGQVLCTYWASGSHWRQVVWQWSTKMRRYCWGQLVRSFRLAVSLGMVGGAYILFDI